MDRLQQRCRRLHQLCQPRPADINAGINQALVLTVQRQMECKLVDGPGPRPVASLGLPRRPATYRPHVFEDHVAAGALCQAVTDLLADDLVFVQA